MGSQILQRYFNILQSLIVAYFQHLAVLFKRDSLYRLVNERDRQGQSC